jgi:cytochrome P450 family 144
MTVCDPIELFDADSLQDPYPLYNQLRAAGAVRRISASEFYAVTSWDAVVDVITRVDEFSSRLTATMVYQPDGTVTAFTMAPFGDPSHALTTADDPAHTAHRKLLLPHLAAKKIGALEDSSPRLPSDCGPIACATGASNGWVPWPTGCQ